METTKNLKYKQTRGDNTKESTSNRSKPKSKTTNLNVLRRVLFYYYDYYILSVWFFRDLLVIVIERRIVIATRIVCFKENYSTLFLCSMLVWPFLFLFFKLDIFLFNSRESFCVCRVLCALFFFAHFRLIVLCLNKEGFSVKIRKVRCKTKTDRFWIVIAKTKQQ